MSEETNKVNDEYRSSNNPERVSERQAEMYKNLGPCLIDHGNIPTAVDVLSGEASKVEILTNIRDAAEQAVKSCRSYILTPECDIKENIPYTEKPIGCEIVLRGNDTMHLLGNQALELQRQAEVALGTLASPAQPEGTAKPQPRKGEGR